jgi:hypothetical protein
MSLRAIPLAHLQWKHPIHLSLNTSSYDMNWEISTADTFCGGEMLHGYRVVEKNFWSPVQKSRFCTMRIVQKRLFSRPVYTTGVIENPVRFCYSVIAVS